MRYNDEAIEQVRNTDLVIFLQQYKGFTFFLRGCEYRCKEHQSLVIRDNRLLWYWHSRGIGGCGAIDFLVKAENMGFREAVQTIRTSSAGMVQPCEAVPDVRQGSLILPEKAGFLNKRLWAYLTQTRGIDPAIVTKLIQEKKLYEDKKGNVVFVGCDENNIPRFASLRGTYSNSSFRMDCAGSDKRYSFNMWGWASTELYIFESPIDCLSHATLRNIQTGQPDAWRLDSRLSLGGTSEAALAHYLERHKDVKKLVFCLDNDQTGQVAAARFVEKYRGLGYLAETELPSRKDYNEDLLAYKAEISVKRPKRRDDMAL